MDNLRIKVLKSIKWNYFGNFSSSILQPLVTIILAKLLTPKDFGTFGLALVFISLIMLFKDFGLSSALIQNKDSSEKINNTVFYSNFFIGSSWFFLIYILSPYFSRFVGDDNLCEVIRVLALYFIISSFSTVQIAILKKKLGFKKLFYVNIVSTIVSAVLTIGIALFKRNVWALVFGFLLNPIIISCLIWFYEDWRPKLIYELSMAKSLFRFGGFVSIEIILIWLISKVDVVFVGKFLGNHQLGIYWFGYNIAAFPLLALVMPLNEVLYSALCKLGDNLDTIRGIYLKYIDYISTIMFFVYVCIFFISPYFIKFIFSEKWIGAIIVTQLISVLCLLSSLVTINTAIYRAIGRPDIGVKFYFIRLLFTMPVFYWSVQSGLKNFCIAQIILCCIFIPINILICSKVLAVKFIEIFRVLKFPFIGIAGVILTQALLKFFTQEFFGIKYLDSTLYSLVAFVLISLVYWTIIWFPNKKLRLLAISFFNHNKLSIETMKDFLDRE